MIQDPRAKPNAQELPSPMLIGEHPALDFLNSCFTPHAEMIDLISTGSALLNWLNESGVAPNARTCAEGLSSKQLDAAAADARTLREWFRQVLARWSVEGARGVRKADLDKLNTYLSQGELHQHLSRRDDSFEMRTERVTNNPAVIAAALAEACADLLVNQTPDKVRKCENPCCTLWFADTKRGPKRRWCSMAACGNRMKVAAHRARRHT